jgi:hypothetical protein
VAQKPRKQTTKVREKGQARERRREQIAVGAVQGKSVTQIAGEVGISRVWCSKELNRPETQNLIRSWMEPHREAIKRMIPRALAAVNESLKPSQDIRDRLSGVKTLGTVMDWAEGEPGDDSDNSGRKWSGSLTELLDLYNRVVERPSSVP